MTTDDAETIVRAFTAAISQKSDHLVHRMSELQGYKFEEIETAMKLKVALEHLESANDPTVSVAFKERVGTFGGLAIGMHAMFVPDDKFDDLLQLPTDSQEKNIAATQLMTAWQDENNLDYQRWLAQETVESFANYCRHIGADNPSYWELVYTHLGLRYPPVGLGSKPSPARNFLIDSRTGDSATPWQPTKKQNGRGTNLGIDDWIAIIVTAGMVIAVLVLYLVRWVNNR